MIIVYPMMVSNAISENTLPALTKMLEQYILVYMQDDYIKVANGWLSPSLPVKMRYKIRGGKIIGESVDLNEVTEDDATDEEKAEREKKAKEYLDKKEQEKKERQDKEDKAISMATYPARKGYGYGKGKLGQKISDSAKSAKVDVKPLDKKTISLEPTYMTIYTEKYGTTLLGIKVVPYRVISDAKLSQLLMHDTQVKGISAATIPLGRSIMSWILRKAGGKITGDPKHDIIYRATGHKGETFVALEKNHDIDEYFIQNADKIRRLFKMGWGNFVICDDILQIASFCLRATKGICQAMSYRMMYKTLGQSDIYDSLEDLRKQNSSIFKVRSTRLSKILGESKVEQKLFDYQERQ